MEIVDAPGAQPSMDDPVFRNFQINRDAALEAAVPNVHGAGTYINTNGESIHFVVSDDGSWIVDVNGVSRLGVATRGDVINLERSGEATISSPFSTAKVVIDFTQWDDPHRRELP
jgi:hypothetical protein